MSSGTNSILAAQEAPVLPNLIAAGPATGTLAAPFTWRTAVGADIFAVQAGLAATGSTITNAAKITPSGGVIEVTGSDGTKAVVLPAAQPGQVFFIGNSAANTLIIFPSTSSGTINGSASYTGGSSKMVIVWCVAVSSLNGTYYAMTG